MRMSALPGRGVGLKYALVVLHAAALHEADLGVEVVLHVEIVQPHVPRRIAIRDAAEERHVLAAQPRRVGLGDERVDLQVLAQREVRVSAHRAVVVRVAAHRLLVDEDRADARPLQHVAAVARDEEVVAGPAERAVGLDVEHADVVPARLAGETRAADDRNRLCRCRTGRCAG